jgi:hypothetical protein
MDDPIDKEAEMANSTNGWLRLALVVYALIAISSSIGTIRGFVTDWDRGRLRWTSD